MRICHPPLTPHLVAVSLVDHLLGLEERLEVIGETVVVSAVNDAVDQRLEGGGLPEDALSNGIDGLLERVWNFDAAEAVRVSEIVNLVRSVSEEEDIVVADLLGDLDVGAIDGTQDETTVEAELHVGRSGSLGTGSRDVERDIRGGDEQLGETDTVVGKEDDLVDVLHVLVGIDDL